MNFRTMTINVPECLHIEGPSAGASSKQICGSGRVVAAKKLIKADIASRYARPCRDPPVLYYYVATYSLIYYYYKKTIS